MHLSTRAQIVFVSLLYIVLLLWDVALYSFLEKNTLWHYLFNIGYGLLYLSGAIIALRGASKTGNHTDFGRALIFIGSAMLIWFIGLVIWMFYNLVLAVAIPYPSFADTAFIFFTPLMVIGCLYLFGQFTQTITPALSRDFTILIILAFLLVLGFYSLPDLSTTLPLAELFVNAAYPISDAVLVALAFIAIRAVEKKISFGMILLEAGFILQAAADILFSYLNKHGLYWNGDISDLLFMTAAFFMTMGIIYIISNYRSSALPTSENAPMPLENHSPVSV